MNPNVVVLGAGYAGAGAIRRLERAFSPAALTWVADNPYHLVLHESHRVIRNPTVADKITIPVTDIKSPGTTFIEDTVTGLDTDERTVRLADGDPIEYDYLLVALGSDTAFYGIPGLEDNAYTLKSLDDAVAIHEAVVSAATNARPDDSAQVIVGGGGLSGVQTAGELATLRNDLNLPIDIVLAEALPEILPGKDTALQSTVRGLLADAGVAVMTNDPITEAEPDVVHFDERESLPYDVLVWTGGVTGRECLDDVDVENRHNRLLSSDSFETSDPRVFAIGDSAIIEQPESYAPPTAQAAWQAAAVVADNIAATVDGDTGVSWEYTDKGTLISVGERAIAHDVLVPPMEAKLPWATFGGYPAMFLKKFVAARWIADLTSWPRAIRAWDVL